MGSRRRSLDETGRRSLCCELVSCRVCFDHPPPRSRRLIVAKSFPQDARSVVEAITGDRKGQSPFICYWCFNRINRFLRLDLELRTLEGKLEKEQMELVKSLLEKHSASLCDFYHTNFTFDNLKDIGFDYLPFEYKVKVKRRSRSVTPTSGSRSSSPMWRPSTPDGRRSEPPKCTSTLWWQPMTLNTHLRPISPVVHRKPPKGDCQSRSSRSSSPASIPSMTKPSSPRPLRKITVGKAHSLRGSKASRSSSPSSSTGKTDLHSPFSNSIYPARPEDFPIKLNVSNHRDNITHQEEVYLYHTGFFLSAIS